VFESLRQAYIPLGRVKTPEVNLRSPTVIRSRISDAWRETRTSDGVNVRQPEGSFKVVASPPADITPGLSDGKRSPGPPSFLARGKKRVENDDSGGRFTKDVEEQARLWVVRERRSS
jgi:hypothetical protein